MVTVAYAAPFFLETTVQFLEAAVRHPRTRVVLISKDPVSMLSTELRRGLSGHIAVKNPFDVGELARAVATIERRFGRVDRLLGTLEQLQTPLARVRDALSIEGLGEEAAENFRDKDRMKTVLREAGIPCARHRLATDAEEAREGAAKIGFPLVAKPPAGAGAKGTHQVADEGDLEQVLRLYRPRAEAPLLLEEFVQGSEHSFDGVSIDGQVVWHSATHYYPGPLEVIENPWIQWCVLLPREIDEPEFDDIREVAAQALDVLGMTTGVSHMEWFRRTDGTIAVSEVGARPGGAQFSRLISYAHDFDFYRAWARLMIDGAFDPPERSFAAGIAFLRGQGRGRVRGLRGIEKAQRDLGPLVVEARLPKTGQAPSTSYEGEGWVILRHRRTEVVKDALRHLISTVRVELG